MNDTTPSVAEFYRIQIMKRSASERLYMGVRMFESARRLVPAFLPKKMTAAERDFSLFMRFYGHEFDVETQQQVRLRMLDRAGDR